MSPGRPGEERAGTGWSRTALPLQPGFAKIQLPKFPETKVPGPGPRLSPDIGPKDSDQRGRPLRRIHPEEGGGACSRPPHSHLGVRNLGERGPQEVRPFAGEGLRWAGGLLPGKRGRGPGAREGGIPGQDPRRRASKLRWQINHMLNLERMWFQTGDPYPASYCPV